MSFIDTLYAALHPHEPRALPAELEPDDLQAPGNPRGQIIIADPIATSAILSPGSDNLRVCVCASMVGTVLLTGLVRTSSGNLHRIGPNGAGYTIELSSDRAVRRFDFSLGPGQEVFELNCQTANTVPGAGQAYVVVQRTRVAPDGTTDTVGTKMAGYVGNNQPLAWPGAGIEPSTQGEPLLRSILGTTPAVGAEISETVPTNTRWEVLSLRALYTPDATPAARLFALNLGSLASIFATINQQNGVGASQPRSITWAANVQPLLDIGSVFFQAPIMAPALILAAQSFFTTTKNIQAGDQYTNVVYQVKEWLDVDA